MNTYSKGMHSQSEQITNWPETIVYPTGKYIKVASPKTPEDVAKTVRRAKKRGHKIGILGSNWNWVKIIDPDKLEKTNQKVILIDTTTLTDFVEPDLETKTAWINPGMNIYDAAKELQHSGLAFEILGLVHGQTLGGVCGTGTHGGSLTHPCISALALKYRLVNADAEIVEIDIKNQPAYGVSLGLLGVIVGIQVQCVDDFDLEAKAKSIKFDNLLADWDKIMTDNEYVDVTWFPTSGECRLTTFNRSEHTESRPLPNFENKVETFNKFVKIYQKTMFNLPRSSSNKIQSVVEKTANSVSAKEKQSYQSDSYNILTMNHELNIKHWEFELAFDYQDRFEVLRKCQQLFNQKKHKGYIAPINIRVSKRDRLWLSPGYKRDTLWVDFLVTKSGERNFDIVDEIAQELLVFSPRVHWGKIDRLEKLQPGYVAKQYPKWRDFWRLKQHVDPDEIFIMHHAMSFCQKPKPFYPRVYLGQSKISSQKCTDYDLVITKSKSKKTSQILKSSDIDWKRYLLRTNGRLNPTKRTLLSRHNLSKLRLRIKNSTEYIRFQLGKSQFLMVNAKRGIDLEGLVKEITKLLARKPCINLIVSGRLPLQVIELFHFERVQKQSRNVNIFRVIF